jgi:serine protease Do
MLNVSVSVKTLSHVRVDAVGDSIWNPSAGSGFLISSRDCEVLTNHHVIAEAAHIEIYPRRWAENKGIPATVVNSNPRSDIAVLRMSDCSGIPEATMGNSDQLRPGDEVFAVGNPLGTNPDSISQGIVSHTRRLNSGLIPYLQTDASISHGSSGGALFNRQGEVIGINTAIAATRNGGNAGIGYALPINLVKHETSKLHDGPPTWGDAGIEDLLTGLTEREAAFFGVPEGRAAIIVTDSPEDGPSKGKLFAKDVVYGIDNVSITSANQAHRLINNYNPGREVKFRVVRSGQHIDVGVTLAEGWQTKESPEADYYAGHLGMTAEMWSDMEDWKNYFDSPVITKIHSLGPAHLAFVTSSQKTFARSGPLVIPVQLSVNTVTGIAFDGNYYTIKSVDALEHLAAEAFAENFPILLEIEFWGRDNPLNIDEPVRRQRTTFHTVMPALSSAEAPGVEDTPGIDIALDGTGSVVSDVAYFDGERRR